MDKSKLDRRAFLANSARAGVAMCGACLCGQLPAFADETAGSEEQEPIDPKKVNYCGHTCSPDCKFKKATLENDVELKKEAWKLWKIEENYGLEFDPDQAICYGCKAPGKPEGVVVSNCTVRSCAQEKKLDCCIECDDLVECSKSLWTRFPDFHKAVIAEQVKYRAQT
ncbi:MAG: DUF3795 domain-containing protein [bacterium]|nr:DUF3795 domain-containing protein [bacterium]